MFIRQVSGAVLVSNVIDALNAAIGATEQFRWNISTSVSSIALSLTATINDLQADQNFMNFMRTLGDSDFIVCLSMEVNAPEGQNALSFTQQPDAISGKFDIPQSRYGQMQIALIKALRERFHISDYLVFLQSSQTDLVSRALREREVSLATLEAHSHKLHTFLQDLAVSEREGRQKLQLELHDDYEARRAKLEEAHQLRIQALEDQKRAMEADFQRREAQFKQRQEAFETRESKYVRRDLLKRIEEVVRESQNLQLSNGTSKKRRGVHAVLLLLVFGPGMVFGTLLWKFLTSGSPDWHIMLPLAASFTTSVSSLIYYVRWMDRWFREHADLEFQASRYKADMLRASWVVELVAEMRQDGENSEVPMHLLEALTRNLFSSGEQEASEHPLEHITGVFRRANELQFNKNGFTVKSANGK